MMPVEDEGFLYVVVNACVRLILKRWPDIITADRIGVWVEISPVLMYSQIGPNRLSPKNLTGFRLFSYTQLNKS